MSDHSPPGIKPNDQYRTDDRPDADTGSPQKRLLEAAKQLRLAAYDDRLKITHQKRLIATAKRAESIAKYAPATEGESE